MHTAANVAADAIGLHLLGLKQPLWAGGYASAYDCLRAVDADEIIFAQAQRGALRPNTFSAAFNALCE